jgi:Spy/CpxP family protein refolding chaperone
MLVATSMLALAAAGAHAADDKATAPGRPPGLGEDPIGSKLFPPELIMGHQQELGIDDKQRAAIIKEIEKAQSQVLQVQWQMQAVTEQLGKLLDAPRIDESKALAQADKVMQLEREVKRAHLGLLIRIKNLLSDSQRAKLHELRTKPAP